MKMKIGAMVFAAMTAVTVCGQTLEGMRWLNEPEKWAVRDGALTMRAPAKTDYWRGTFYGFTVDDGPFLYTERGGEFEAKVRVQCTFAARFDHAGLMVRIDAENWLKTGIEFVDGAYNVSTVVTHGKSDWSVIRLPKPVEAIWIKAVRRKDSVDLYYSADDRDYVQMRTAWMADGVPVKVGLMAASPDGDGFDVKFSDFSVRHLPDARRLEWLKANPE